MMSRWLGLLLIACLMCSSVYAGSSLSGKKALIVIAPSNFQDQEYSETRNALENEGATITVASSATGTVTGMFGLAVKPDISLSAADATAYDAVVFIGGSGVTAYWDDTTAQNLAKASVNAGKITGAICWAPIILCRAGLLSGKQATVAGDEQKKELRDAGATVPTDSVVTDGKLVTGDGPEAAAAFGQALVTLLKGSSTTDSSTTTDGDKPPAGDTGTTSTTEAPTTIQPSSLLPFSAGNVWTYTSSNGGAETQKLSAATGSFAAGTLLVEMPEENEKQWQGIDAAGLVIYKGEQTDAGESSTITADTFVVELPSMLVLNQTFGAMATVTEETGSTSTTHQIAVTFQYTGMESVTVPAGTFDCYVIIRTENIDNGTQVMQDTIYLSENAGIVKVVSLETEGGETSSETQSLAGAVIDGKEIIGSGSSVAIGMPEDTYSASLNEAVLYLSIYGSNAMDVYLVLALPDDGGFVSWTPSGFVGGIQPFVSNWSAVTISAYPVFSMTLPSLPAGAYQWYAVLAQPGSDPLNSSNWLSVATERWSYTE